MRKHNKWRQATALITARNCRERGGAQRPDQPGPGSQLTVRRWVCPGYFSHSLKFPRQTLLWWCWWWSSWWRWWRRWRWTPGRWSVWSSSCTGAPRTPQPPGPRDCRAPGFSGPADINRRDREMSDLYFTNSHSPSWWPPPWGYQAAAWWETSGCRNISSPRPSWDPPEKFSPHRRRYQSSSRCRGGDPHRGGGQRRAGQPGPPGTDCPHSGRPHSSGGEDRPSGADSWPSPCRARNITIYPYIYYHHFRVITSCLGRCRSGHSSCLGVSSRPRPPPAPPPPPAGPGSLRCGDSDGRPCQRSARGNTCTGNIGSPPLGQSSARHSPRHWHRRGGPWCCGAEPGH